MAMVDERGTRSAHVERVAGEDDRLLFPRASDLHGRVLPRVEALAHRAILVEDRLNGDAV